MENLSELAAALNGHQITDEDGQETEEETSFEDTATQETTIDDSTTAEKSAESEEEDTQTSDEDDETTPVEDEQGKRYVPEKRFKDIYGKYKQTERELEELRNRSVPNVQLPQAPVADKTALLETELLYTQFPQFSPSSPEYNEDLDKVAANIYLSSNGRITKVEAARQAINIAKNLQAKTSSIKEEARVIKRMVSESNTTKGGQRVEPSVDPDKMSVDELEAYLKATKQW